MELNRQRPDLSQAFTKVQWIEEMADKKTAKCLKRLPNEDVIQLDRQRQSSAHRNRLKKALNATKLDAAYKRHPIASRVMTFSQFKNPVTRKKILSQFNHSNQWQDL